jgi:hypothetical protein
MLSFQIANEARGPNNGVHFSRNFAIGFDWLEIALGQVLEFFDSGPKFLSLLG